MLQNGGASLARPLARVKHAEKVERAARIKRNFFQESFASIMQHSIIQYNTVSYTAILLQPEIKQQCCLVKLLVFSCFEASRRRDASRRLSLPSEKYSSVM